MNNPRMERTIIRLRLCGNSANIRLLIDEIGPPLQHCAAMLEIQSCVIGAPNFILVDMSELGFNPVGFEMTSFIQNR